MLPKYRKPIHPGEILSEEFLEPLGLSQEEFALHMGNGWTQPKVSAIVNERRGITEAIALDLADALGTTAEFWMNLQTRYDLWSERKKHKKIPLLPAMRRARSQCSSKREARE